LPVAGYPVVDVPKRGPTLKGLQLRIRFPAKSRKNVIEAVAMTGSIVRGRPTHLFRHHV